MDVQTSHLQAWWRHVANSQPAGEGLGNLFTDLPEDFDWNSLKNNVSLQEMSLFLAYFLDTLGNKIISHLFSVIFLIILILIGFSFKKLEFNLQISQN